MAKKKPRKQLNDGRTISKPKLSTDKEGSKKESSKKKK